MNLHQLAQNQDPDALSFWFVAFVVLYSFGIIVSAIHLALLIRPAYQGRHYDAVLAIAGCVLWPITISCYSYFAVSKSVYSRRAVKDAGIKIMAEIDGEIRPMQQISADELEKLQKQQAEKRAELREFYKYELEQLQKLLERMNDFSEYGKWIKCGVWQSGLPSDYGFYVFKHPADHPCDHHHFILFDPADERTIKHAKSFGDDAMHMRVL